MADAYSIRDSLQGALHDFVRDAGFASVEIEEIIRELVGLLAAYREEDVPLFPEVFVFASPEGLKALAPSLQPLYMGVTSLAANSAEIVIKNCGRLAEHGWAIFLVKDTDQIRRR